MLLVDKEKYLIMRPKQSKIQLSLSSEQLRYLRAFDGTAWVMVKKIWDGGHCIVETFASDKV